MDGAYRPRKQLFSPIGLAFWEIHRFARSVFPSPCQGKGREFESLHPLNSNSSPEALFATVARLGWADLVAAFHAQAPAG